MTQNKKYLSNVQVDKKMVIQQILCFLHSTYFPKLLYFFTNHIQITNEIENVSVFILYKIIFVVVNDSTISIATVISLDSFN